MSRRRFVSWLCVIVACAALGLWRPTVPVAAADLTAQTVFNASPLAGGLCVQVGAGNLSLAEELAKTGRFLVQVLDCDPAAVDEARNRLRSQNLYGLISVDRLDGSGKLPLAENLVNLLLVDGDAAIAEAEIARVLCPNGVVLVRGGGVGRPAPSAAMSGERLRAAGLEDAREVPAARGWLMARKAWPAGMDEWTHPRHAADGNAVSQDTLVGPPRRVRWVVGEKKEDSNMVSAAGRNYYYSGLVARDGFNGLRLWERAASPSSSRGANPSAGKFQPVACGNLLFVVSEKKLKALDGATGQAVREYPDAGDPSEVLVDGGRLVAIDSEAIRVLDVETGRLLWKIAAAEPQYAVAGDNAVYFLEGAARRGEKLKMVSRALADGKVHWLQADYPWLDKVRRLVYHGDLLVCEISTLSNDKPGNRVELVSAADGKSLWNREFLPGMNHRKQARGMFVGDLLWLLEDHECSSLDPRTGEVRETFDAGFCHCFPPVATRRYLFGGEMHLTDLESGLVDANRITKGACGRDAGWVPANGLINVFPKHCVCWPMLRGFAALAPAATEIAVPERLDKGDFLLEKGPAGSGDPRRSLPGDPRGTLSSDSEAWPCYRHDAWRSGATTADVELPLKPLWETSLGDRPQGPIADDWREDPFVKGPITPPVSAEGMVYVARPDAHELVALDLTDGSIRWRFTANGRIDTAPTIHRGLCLFGTKAGWVYCLSARDGRLVWRLRAAPNEERIVAYGQLESPWPVPGSVLVADDVAYFAAGRQPLADGGIFVFAVDPPTGKIHWVQRLDSLPFKNFYASCALEFDNFDLLALEGDRVAMARWLFDRTDGQMTCEETHEFAQIATGGSGVMAPRSCWTYAPRQQPRHAKDLPTRALVVFRDDLLFGSTEDRRSAYRRDFHLDQGQKFDQTWITGWAAVEQGRHPDGLYAPSQRLAQDATWSVPVLDEQSKDQQIGAMLLAGGRIFLAGTQGGLTVVSADDGRVVSRADLPASVWDGMAAASGRLLASTQDGRVVCLGKGR